MKRHFAALLVTAIAGLAPASADTVRGTLTLIPATADENRLTVTISASGASDSDTTDVSGTLSVALKTDPAGATSQFTIQSGNLDMTDMDFDLRTLGISIATINTSGMGGTAYTNTPPGLVTPTGSGGSFDASLHRFSINEGAITGELKIPFQPVVPIDESFADSPVDGNGLGTGDLTVTPGVITGTKPYFTVAMTLPIDFTDTQTIEGTEVTIHVQGTIKATGTVAAQVLVTDFSGFSESGNLLLPSTTNTREQSFTPSVSPAGSVTVSHVSGIGAGQETYLSDEFTPLAEGHRITVDLTSASFPVAADTIGLAVASTEALTSRTNLLIWGWRSGSMYIANFDGSANSSAIPNFPASGRPDSVFIQRTATGWTLGSIKGGVVTINYTNITKVGSTTITADGTAVGLWSDMRSNTSTWTVNNLVVAPPDTTPPTLISTSTTVPYSGGKVVLDFNERITLPTSGVITLNDTTDGSGTVVINLPDPQVTVSGSRLTIKPTTPLKAGANYDLLISNDAINDLALPTPNAFAGTTAGQWSFTPVPLAINNFVDGSDAATGISTSTVYTHLVDIQKDSDTAVINGVTFDNVLANYTLTGTTGNLVNTSNGASAGTGMGHLLNNFSYGGTVPAPPVLTLSGLTPGQTYKLRLYVSSWLNRTVNFAFDNTTPATTVGDIDRGAGQTIPSSFDYTYTLAPGDTDLAVTITPGTDTFHWYGFSNELVGAPANTFSNWIANSAFGIGPDDRDLLDDPDKDNLPNGVEAWFGTHPGQFSAGLSGPSTNGTVTTFTHPKNSNPPSDLGIDYQWSPDLTTWYAGNGVDGPPGGPTMNIQALPAAGTTTVTATASAPLGRIFLRAGVKQN